jgi:hypothetical protein
MYFRIKFNEYQYYNFFVFTFLLLSIKFLSGEIVLPPTKMQTF